MKNAMLVDEQENLGLRLLIIVRSLLSSLEGSIYYKPELRIRGGSSQSQEIYTSFDTLNPCQAQSECYKLK